MPNKLARQSKSRRARPDYKHLGSHALNIKDSGSNYK
jgi:hypothetical protein